MADICVFLSVNGSEGLTPNGIFGPKVCICFLFLPKANFSRKCNFSILSVKPFHFMGVVVFANNPFCGPLSRPFVRPLKNEYFLVHPKRNWDSFKLSLAGSRSEGQQIDYDDDIKDR